MSSLAFFQEWIDNGEPNVYWISGFYFTQSFITGVLQNYSRKNRFQIDMIFIEFAVTKFESQTTQVASVGAYIRVSLRHLDRAIQKMEKLVKYLNNFTFADTLNSSGTKRD